MKWGLISKLDSELLMAAIDLVCKEFKGGEINTCCIGVFDGDTDRSIYEYVTGKGFKCNHTAIDNERDKLVKHPFPECNFIRGNSSEVYNKIENNSQHILFIDGLHTFPAVVSDFYCYFPKVKIGGYLCFHDTGKHLDQLSGWQGVGDKNDPDMCLGGVRRALKEIGLFNKWGGGAVGGVAVHHIGCKGFELIFDEADPNDSGGGMSIFKKLY